MNFLGVPMMNHVSYGLLFKKKKKEKKKSCLYLIYCYLLTQLILKYTDVNRTIYIKSIVSFDVVLNRIIKNVSGNQHAKSVSSFFLLHFRPRLIFTAASLISFKSGFSSKTHEAEICYFMSTRKLASAKYGSFE